ncbi:hypothetical protein [Gordonia sp. UBA5067]|nr:hypothetical protein [Gordonia sp. UBA5067]
MVEPFTVRVRLTIVAPGGRTPWSAIDLSAIADMADSMGAEQAAADAAALVAAIERAQAVARRVEAVFASTASSLAGAAAAASGRAASAVAADVVRAAAVARSASSALRGVANALAATKAKGPALRAAAQELAAADLRPDEVARVRETVAGAMNAVYSDPMLATSTPVGDAPRRSVPYDGAAAVLAGPSAANQGGQFAATLGRVSPSAARGTPAAPGPAGRSPKPMLPPVGRPPATDQAGQVRPPGPPGSSGPPAAAHRPVGGSPAGVGPNPPPGGPVPGIGGPRRLGVPLGGRPGRVGGGPVGGRPVVAPNPPRPGAPRLAQTATPGSPVPAALPRSAASPGMRGGMPYAPRAGRTEESADRRPAPYLRVRENAEAVAGELPLVGPAVIGEPEPVPDPPGDPDSPAPRR